MKRWIIAILFSQLFLVPVSHAGMGACHDGAGNITELELDGNHSFFQSTPDCEYYSLPPTDPAKFDQIRTLIKTVPRKHIKWDGEPVEMTQAEKDTVDADLAAARLQEARDAASAEMDNRHIIKALALIMMEEINRLRADIEDMSNESPQITDRSRPDRTLDQLKTAIKNRIQSGDVD